MTSMLERTLTVLTGGFGSARGRRLFGGRCGRSRGWRFRCPLHWGGRKRFVRGVDDLRRLRQVLDLLDGRRQLFGDGRHARGARFGRRAAVRRSGRRDRTDRIRRRRRRGNDRGPCSDAGLSLHAELGDVGELTRGRFDRLVAGHAAAKCPQCQLRDELERLEHAGATRGDGFDRLVLPFRIECVEDALRRQDVRQVTLVELDDQRNLVHRKTDLAEVLAQVLEALEVRLEHRHLGVRHEHQAVDSLQHEFARRVVEDLSGDRVQLKAGLEAADDADVDRQQVEEQRAVGLCLQADHLPAALRRRLRVDVVEIGRLPAETRTVVHDLRGHLHRRVIEEDHSLCGSP
jgi:hypothetical protein